MQNAFNMTHPVIPQSNQFVTLEYLESLGIDENFKVSTITLTNPTLSNESSSTTSDDEYERTITQNISEFVDSVYVSKVNSLSVYHDYAK